MIQEHIQKIQEKLQEISYQGNPLEVSNYYITSADRYPYFFITDGRIINNSGGNQYEMGLNGTYYRKFQYEINMIFAVDTSNMPTIQDEIREISELLISKLSSQDMLSSGLPWTDFNFREADAPIRGVDVGLSDACIIRVFRCEVEVLIDIP